MNPKEKRFSLRSASRVLCIDREKLAMLCDARLEGRSIIEAIVVPGRFRRRLYITATELDRVRRVVVPRLREILAALEYQRAIGGNGGAVGAKATNAANNLA